MQLAKHNVGEIIIDSNITKKDSVYSSKCVLRKNISNCHEKCTLGTVLQ